ncbi:MAG: type II secretion system protein [Deltaproteobacteria bacterium]|nr:type II secretion system protein [Deltaproteobacteria bacterium]
MITCKSQRGFTLIEVMVALLILAGLSVLMAQSVRSGLQNRQKVQKQIAEESIIRDAMRIVASDVGAAFHHRDYTVATYNKILELRKKKAASATGGGTPAPGAPTPTPGVAATPAQPDPLASATPLPTPQQLTAFVGNGEQLTFTVRNHVRRYLDAKESDQATVFYFLRSCRSGENNKYYSSCLVRLERTEPTNEFPLSPRDEADSQAQVLVPYVTEFKLRYIAAGMSDFTDTWDSRTESTSAATRGNFPDAVEVTLTVQNKEDKNSKARSLTWLAPVRHSNNPDESEKTGSGTPRPGATPTGAQQ